MNLSKKQFFPALRSGRSATLCEVVAILVILLILLIAGILSGCNVTRTVTTKAEYYQRGDTTIQIVTRTTESYDGKVDATKLLQAGAAAGGL